MILFDIFRWFAIIQGFWLYWLFFKRKTYYEDGNPRRKSRRFKGAKLIISIAHPKFREQLTQDAIKLGIIPAEG